MEVYDHEGTLIAEGIEFGGTWAGDFPNEVFDVMYATLEANPAPSRYNQMLIAHAAMDRITRGRPPDPPATETIDLNVSAAASISESVDPPATESIDLNVSTAASISESVGE